MKNNGPNGSDDNFIVPMNDGVPVPLDPLSEPLRHAVKVAGAIVLSLQADLHDLARVRELLGLPPREPPPR